MISQESSAPEAKETVPEVQRGWFSPDPVEPQGESQSEKIDTPESEAGEKLEEDATSEDTIKDDSGTEDYGDDTDLDHVEKKSGKGFEKRIERYSRRLQEKDLEVEHWKKIALSTTGNKTESNTPVVQEDTPKPVFSQYGDIDTYTEALTDWKLKRALAEQEIKRHNEQRTKTYAEREAIVRQANPDYDEVISDFKSKYNHVNVPEVNQYLAESEKGAELFLYLARNNTELDRILGLPPIRRIGELGKMETKLVSAGAGTTKTAPKTSSAPKPVAPEKSNSQVSKRLDDPNLSQKEYRELRMAAKKRF